MLAANPNAFPESVARYRFQVPLTVLPANAEVRVAAPSGAGELMEAGPVGV